MLNTFFSTYSSLIPKWANWKIIFHLAFAFLYFKNNVWAFYHFYCFFKEFHLHSKYCYKDCTGTAFVPSLPSFYPLRGRERITGAAQWGHAQWGHGDEDGEVRVLLCLIPAHDHAWKSNDLFLCWTTALEFCKLIRIQRPFPYDRDGDVVAFLAGGQLGQAAPHLHLVLLYPHLLPCLSDNGSAAGVFAV